MLEGLYNGTLSELNGLKVKTMKYACLSMLVALTALQAATAGELETAQMPAGNKTGDRLVIASKKNLRQTTFKVMGLGCGACIKRVERLLQKEKGVVEAKIELYPKGQTKVIYDPGRTSLEKVTGVIFKEDYAIENIKDTAVEAGPPRKVADLTAKPGEDTDASPASHTAENK